jgi:hypothetical protein
MPIFIWWEQSAILITKEARYIVPAVIATAGAVAGFFVGKREQRRKGADRAADRGKKHRIFDESKGETGVIKDPAGGELPFGWGDVWYNIEFGGLALLIGCLALFAQYHLELLLFIFLTGMLLIEFVLPWERTRRKRSIASGRRKILGLCESAVIVILLIGYITWLFKLEPPPEFSAGAMILICGSIVALKAFSRGNLHSLGYAIPLMLCGILILFLEVNHWVLCGFTLAIAGGATAAVQGYWLKRNRTSRKNK